jgi:hypothetical protein
MKRNAFVNVWVVLAWLLVECALAVRAQGTGASNQFVRYRLTDGSTLLNDCPICDRLSVPVPMDGRFDLRLASENPINTHYEITNINFTATNPDGSTYVVTGFGGYDIGGEVAIVQSMYLQVQIDTGLTNVTAYMTNVPGYPLRRGPMMAFYLAQTNGTPIQTFYLNLPAAPIRDIWFSTSKPFTATSPAVNPSISDGDLLSASGQIVKSNQQLTELLGIMPIVPDLGLDALEILPGGEIAFSIRDDVFSETHGTLHSGDVLSNQGRIVWTNEDLLAAFAPQPAASGAGMKGLQFMANGEVYFAIATNVYSGKLGTTLYPGDLLSNAGRIVRRNYELVQNFQPAATNVNYGLDAFYIWPNGDIWFSTTSPFTGANATTFGDGDLLSDQGYIVARNSRLLRSFKPSDTSTDYGLDALYVVTDVRAPASPAQIKNVTLVANTGSIVLSWASTGHVFQVEASADAAGPYQSRGPITPDLVFEDGGVMTNQPQTFYRIGQW